VTRSQRTCLWVAGNACGALLYLYFALRVWPALALRQYSWAERHGPAGDIIWSLSALPTFAGTMILDLGVLLWAAHRRLESSDSPFTRWAWSIPMLWALAIELDPHRM
jgi:hypothetical protein